MLRGRIRGLEYIYKSLDTGTDNGSGSGGTLMPAAPTIKRPKTMIDAATRRIAAFAMAARGHGPRTGCGACACRGVTAEGKLFAADTGGLSAAGMELPGPWQPAYHTA
jgi:hypothetical protein